MRELIALKPMKAKSVNSPSQDGERFNLGNWIMRLYGGGILRWSLPATAVLALVGLTWWQVTSQTEAHRSIAANLTKPARIHADQVSINQDLVSTFDAVSPLPTGEPVRYRCRQWLDEVKFRDSTKGVEVARRIPRLEVQPIGFELY
jgi:hypothetical protein